MIFRFSSHPVAELIKQCVRIENEDRRRSIKLGSNRYYHSEQYNKMEEELIQARVTGNRIRTHLNKPIINLTDIPMYFDDGFLCEHRYSIANFVFWYI